MTYASLAVLPAEATHTHAQVVVDPVPAGASIHAGT